MIITSTYRRSRVDSVTAYVRRLERRLIGSMRKIESRYELLECNTDPEANVNANMPRPVVST